jgi:proteasome accessory factor A
MSPRLRQLDIQYHAIAQDRSLFYLLQQSGQVERLVDARAIEHFANHPPDDTRAYTRAMCLNKYGPSVWAVNWERIWFRLHARPAGGSPDGKMLLLNPLRGTKAEHESLFGQANTAEQFLNALRGGRRENR